MLAIGHIGVGDILIYILAGLIIGLLARLIVPGRQSIGIVVTIVIGIVSAIVGGILWNAIFPKNDGIAWIGALIVAVVIVWIWASVVQRPRRTRI
jgi:uncharacterized membrane protein YeaQ/YmgE (transglycosylase-associated protein family)